MGDHGGVVISSQTVCPPKHEVFSLPVLTSFLTKFYIQAPHCFYKCNMITGNVTDGLLAMDCF